MSILRVDAIWDNGAGFNDVVTFANNGGTENGKLARVWVNFNGAGTVAARASFNVNSISDGGTGTYTINFSNAMADANFAAVGGFDNIQNLAGGNIQSQTTTSVNMTNSTAGNVLYDGDNLSLCVFR